jgi:glyoxylase-like metal-dependent hydrolase (beta-lactamase superfamily II)
MQITTLSCANPAHPALTGLTVLERGWLSSNNILVHATAGEPGAVLIDTGHLVHHEQTVALVRHALAGQPLALIVNTHLHSDHGGGNAALQRALAAPIIIPPGDADAVRRWDLAAMGHDTFSARERFEIAGTLAPGAFFTAGGRRWDALAAPGHDPHSLIVFDAQHGVLLSADALWANGFGVVFSELLGQGGFEEVGATLDLIERLNPKVVVPGHGSPFSDTAAALARARMRLSGFQKDPARHARHAAKVLLKYHLMEVHSQPLEDLVQWAQRTAQIQQVNACLARAANGGALAKSGLAPAPSDGLIQELLQELLQAGVLKLQGNIVSDC